MGRAGNLAAERQARQAAARQLFRARMDLRLQNREQTRQEIRRLLAGTGAAKAPELLALPSEGPASGDQAAGDRAAGGQVSASGAAGGQAENMPAGGARVGRDGKASGAGAVPSGAGAVAGGQNAPSTGKGRESPAAPIAQPPGGPLARVIAGFAAAPHGAALFDAEARLVWGNRVWLRVFDGLAEVRPGIPLAQLLDLGLAEGLFDPGALPAPVWRARQLQRWPRLAARPAWLRLWSGVCLRISAWEVPGAGTLVMATEAPRGIARRRPGAAPALAGPAGQAYCGLPWVFVPQPQPLAVGSGTILHRLEAPLPVPLSGSVPVPVSESVAEPVAVRPAAILAKPCTPGAGVPGHGDADIGVPDAGRADAGWPAAFRFGASRMGAPADRSGGAGGG